MFHMRITTFTSRTSIVKLVPFILGGSFILGLLVFNLQSDLDWFILAAAGRGEEAGSPFRIQRIIHQTWITENIPEEIHAEWIQSWQRHNPGWEYWFWTDADIRCFLSREYPQFLSYYDAYPAGIFRGDAMRYFVLYHFGGVYGDLDTECLKPLDSWLKEHSCVITEDHPYHSYLLFNMDHQELTNAFMMCRKHHPFMKAIISELPRRVKIPHVLKATGPTLVTDIYTGYPYKTDSSDRKKLPRNVSEIDYVSVSSYRNFMPTFDPEKDALFKDMCSEKIYSRLHPRQQNMCQQFRSENLENKVFNTSYVNHHWVHTYMYNKWGKMKTVSVRKYVQNVKTYQTVYGECKKI